MDLWSVIPIGVYQYTILSTMVSSISLGNIFLKDTTCKDFLGNESCLVISFHHSILQLTFITQAWMFKFNTCAMQANIWKCTFKCTKQVHELAPPTCVLKILIYPFPFSYLSLIFVSLSPLFLFPPYLCFSPPLSSMTTKVLNVDRISCRVEIIKVNQWGEGHFPKFGSILDCFPKIFNSVWSKDKLLHTSK